MFLRYLTVQKAVLYSLIILFANRSWNYYDKLTDPTSTMTAINQYGIPLLITSCLFFFFLGFAIALEFKDRKKKQPS